MSDMIPNNPLMKIMDASKWNLVNFIASSSFFMRVGCFHSIINLLLLGISILLSELVLGSFSV
jgi:hypothetical protein